MKKYYKKILILIGIILLFLSYVGISYAYWQFNKVQNDLNVTGTNCFSLTYTDNTDSLVLDNIVPTEDEEGLKEKGYSFTVKNTCNTIATYEVNLEDILASSNIKHMPTKYIKVSLNDSTPKVLNTYEEVKTTISNATNSFKLTSGSLRPDEEATYELKLWMDSETPAIDEVMSATFESKITVNTSYITEENLTNDITIIATSQNEDYSKDKETFTIDITSTNKNIIEYSFNNQTWTSVTPSKEVKFNYDFVEEKNYTLYVKDEVGNVKTTEITPSKLDQTAPKIKIETTNNHESYTLKVNLTDIKSGVEFYQITTTKEEPTEWLNYTDTIEKEVTENNTYYIWSKDKLGNISYETIVIDKIDKEAPNIELSQTLTDWGVKDTIQIHLTDDIIGLSGYQIMTSEKEPTDYISLDNSLEENLTYEVTENGTYYVYVKDAYNHVSYKEIIIDKVDNQAPTQIFSVASNTSGSNGWYQSLSIETTVSDSQSGILNSMYCITTEETCEPNVSSNMINGSYTINFNTNEKAQKLCVSATDYVGNNDLKCTDFYNIDTSNPTVTLNANLNKNNITLTATANDLGSGIDTYYYSKDGGKSFISLSSPSYTFALLDDGSYETVIKVKDKAGRFSDEISQIIVVAYQNTYVSSSGNDEKGNGSKNSPYQTILKAFNQVKNGGNINILSDITQSSQKLDISDKNVNLLSSGGTYSVKRSDSNSLFEISNANVNLSNIVIDGANISSTNPLIALGGTMTLNINDGAILKGTSGTGATIRDGSGNVNVNVNGGAVYSTSSNCFIGGGTYTINSGIVSNEENTVDGYPAIYLWTGTRVYVNGGELKANGSPAIYADGGTVTIAGGTISSKNTIYMRDYDTVTSLNIKDGTIISTGSYAIATQNKNTTINISGGNFKSSYENNVLIKNISGTVTITGGNFENVSMLMSNYNIINIKGGTFTQNATKNYSAIKNYMGTINISGGSLNFNKPIRVNENSVLNVTGGTVSSGETNSIINQGTLNLSGTAIIQNNASSYPTIYNYNTSTFTNNLTTGYVKNLGGGRTIYTAPASTS